MIRALYNFFNRNWWQVVSALLAVILALLLTGCGTSTDRQTRTVERLETRTGPLVVDTPIGQFVARPVAHVMVRSQDEVERTEKRIDAPEIGQIAQAASGGSPIGTIIGIGGALVAAFAGKKALDYRRQRNEIVDGIERGSADMPDEAWKPMRAALEAEQSHDTKAAVKGRVG